MNVSQLKKAINMSEPLIFITNDDGVNAKGFRRLVETAARFGRVVAVAPEQTQSGMSHAITMFKPLFLRKVVDESNVRVYSLSGTPVDCVKMAFDYLLEGEKVDLALSGINHGSNSAINVLYSGTMGAAVEGSFYGCPSVGLSLLDHDPDADFDASADIAARIIDRLLNNETKTPVCLNVNIPQGRPEQIRGIRLCRQNRGFWREHFFCRQDPRGMDYFWLTGEFCNEEPEAEDTDEWALNNGYVSVVPIQVDMTDYTQIGRLRDIF